MTEKPDPAAAKAMLRAMANLSVDELAFFERRRKARQERERAAETDWNSRAD
jgi:hypothetical protein